MKADSDAFWPFIVNGMINGSVVNVVIDFVAICHLVYPLINFLCRSCCATLIYLGLLTFMFKIDK